jgi:hypothetical protein
VQIRCWKKTSAVDLASSGGHEARFENRRVFPIRFLLRHYPIRGQAHGERKVFVERQPRFAGEERARGWHVQYEKFEETTAFVQDPCTLTRFDATGVRVDLSLHNRDVESLEQSLGAMRGSLESAQTELHARTKEIEHLQDGLRRRAEEALDLCRRLERRELEMNETRGELASRTTELEAVRDELVARTGELAARQSEAVNLNAAVTDLLKQIDALRQSRTWRWTAPARALYERLAGKVKG